MKLTPELKAEIDAKSYYELLNGWRHTPVGSKMFQDESGEYWQRRMIELRQPVDHVAVSKAVGWGDR